MKKARKRQRRLVDKIRQAFRRAAHPLLPEELQQLLRRLRPSEAEVQAALAELLQRGEIVQLETGRYGLTTAMNLAVGRLTLHPDGYGFVTPEEGEEGDIFINPANLKDALHGDRVVVRVEHRRRRGRREGRVIRILERRLRQVVGILQEAGGRYFVTPDDEHLLFDLLLPAVPEVSAAVGQMVVAEILEYPAARLNPVGRLVAVLGPPEDPAVQAQVVIRKYELPDAFPPSALAQAAALTADLAPEIRRSRLDLTAIPFVTIDGEQARDFDDAVAVRRRPGGGFDLWVGIADVAHYVPPDSPLDQEASRRGTSIYFPNYVLHMFPPALATDICSLKPEAERLAVTVHLVFDRQGRRRQVEFARSIIRSRARLTYDEVERILQGDRPARRRRAELVRMLEQMARLCLLLREQRRRRGSLLLTIPEAEVLLNDQGIPYHVRRLDHLLSHRIIEEFMIAANEAVAEFLAELCLFRVHEPPDPDKMAAFRRFLAKLGLLLPPAADHDPQVLVAFLESIRDPSLAFMIQTLLLRSLRQARYCEENLGHYGLASSCYTHFTSPIRRYPDLVVHRLLLAKLEGRKSPLADPDRLAELAQRLSARERTAIEAEREMLARMQVRCLAEHVGEVFHGTITSVNAFGFFVSLDEIFADGLVRLVDLPDDYYQFQETRLRLKGRRTGRTFQIGDRVTVRVARVDLRRRHINLQLLTESPAAAGTTPGPDRQTPDS